MAVTEIKGCDEKNYSALKKFGYKSQVMDCKNLTTFERSYCPQPDSFIFV